MSPAKKPVSKESRWSGLRKLLLVVVVVSVGLWGCARKPAARSAPERIRQLESRCTRVEQEYRNVSSARDRLRKELELVKAENARLQKEVTDNTDAVRERDEMQQKVNAAMTQQDLLKTQLAKANRERDNMQNQVSLRQTERDNLQGRIEKLRKSLKSVLDEDAVQDPTFSTLAPTSGQ